MLSHAGNPLNRHSMHTATSDIQTTRKVPALAPATCSLPVLSVKLLLEADDIIRRAIVMLDGWERAEAWCNQLLLIRAELEAASERQPEENAAPSDCGRKTQPTDSDAD